MIDGSTLKSLTLPDGGIVEKLQLNALTSLTMQNLTMLKEADVILDEGIYTSMNNLTIKKCPAMDNYSYRMVLNAPMTNYALTDFNWTITSTDDLAVDENNKVTGLKVVDKLMTRLPNGGQHASAFIGNIHVNVAAANINEYELYEKYCETYPNLTITYGEISGLNRAVELRFMSNDTDKAVTHYRVLGAGEADGDPIGILISEDGPTGKALHDPNKEAITDTYYVFTGYWTTEKNPTSLTTRYYVEGLENPIEGAINFNDVVPTQNMVFYPEFTAHTRAYTVKFHDYYGNTVETFDVPYGMTYKAAGGTFTNYYYLESDRAISNTQRYGFRGWSTVKYEADKGSNVVFIDVETHPVKGPLNLYPYYEVEDVYTTPTNPDYFEIVNGALVLKEGYENFLAGKITIPEVIGTDIVGSMRSAPGITHVFFLRHSTHYTTIGANAFSNCSNLVEVALPDSITEIGNYAFRACTKLKTINLGDQITKIGASAFAGDSLVSMIVEIDELPANLVDIGSSAFQNAGENIRFTKIPNGVTTLPTYAFSRCFNVKISEFGSETSGKNLTSIGT